MRGFKNFLIDHRRNPDKVKFLLAHLTGYFVKNMKIWVKDGGHPDGFMIFDDLKIIEFIISRSEFF